MRFDLFHHKSLLGNVSQKMILASLMGLWCLASACGVTVYQPLRGLQTPTIIGATESNFEGMRILVRCVVDDEHMRQGDADNLCRKMRESFVEQGAECEAVSARGSEDRPKLFEGRQPDLTLEIQSKIEHHREDQFLFYASLLTLTIVPLTEEWTYSQRLQVLGKDGSVLAEDIYRSRFKYYGGIGFWTINKLLDFYPRDEDEKITGDVAKKDFSRDFYRHTRQLVFNAKMRSEVLGLTPSNRTRKKRVLAEQAKPDAKTSDDAPIPADETEAEEAVAEPAEAVAEPAEPALEPAEAAEPAEPAADAPADPADPEDF